MFSHDEKIILKQSVFLKSTEVFLQALKTGESIDLYKGGVCTGLTKMMIRAYFTGESDKYLNRMKKICLATDAQLKMYADLYLKYQHQFRQFQKLIKNSDLTSFIRNIYDSYKYEKFFNGREYIFEELNSEVIHLNDSKSSPQAVAARFLEKLTMIQIAIEKFKQDNINCLDEIKFSCEFYAFIQSVILLQSHVDRKLLRIEDKTLGVEREALHNDLVETLNIIAPDKTVSMHRVYSFGFVLTLKELKYALESSVKEGDLVFMSSEFATKKNHAIFITRCNQGWKLIDPNCYDLSLHEIFYNTDQLGEQIEKSLFTNFKPSTNEFFPIAFSAFAQQQDNRINEKSLVDSIMDKRDKSTGINMCLDDDISAIDVAVGVNNHKLVDAVLEYKPAIGSYSFLNAPTSLIFDKLHSNTTFFNRQRSELLLSGLVVAASIALVILSSGLALIPAITVVVCVVLFCLVSAYGITTNMKVKEQFQKNEIKLTEHTVRDSKKDRDIKHSYDVINFGLSAFKQDVQQDVKQDICLSSHINSAVVATSRPSTNGFQNSISHEPVSIKHRLC